MLCSECHSSPALTRFRDVHTGKVYRLCPECAARIQTTSATRLVPEGPANELEFLTATA